MDLELYHTVRNIEKSIKEKYNLKVFDIYIPTIDMGEFSLIFQENENNPKTVKVVIDNFVEILKSKGYRYKFDTETPSPIQISDVDEYGKVARETTRNYYTVKKEV